MAEAGSNGEGRIEEEKAVEHAVQSGLVRRETRKRGAWVIAQKALPQASVASLGFFGSAMHAAQALAVLRRLCDCPVPELAPLAQQDAQGPHVDAVYDALGVAEEVKALGCGSTDVLPLHETRIVESDVGAAWPYGVTLSSATDSFFSKCQRGQGERQGVPQPHFEARICDRTVGSFSSMEGAMSAFDYAMNRIHGVEPNKNAGFASAMRPLSDNERKRIDKCIREYNLLAQDCHPSTGKRKQPEANTRPVAR